MGNYLQMYSVEGAPPGPAWAGLEGGEHGYEDQQERMGGQAGGRVPTKAQLALGVSLLAARPSLEL